MATSYNLTMASDGMKALPRLLPESRQFLFLLLLSVRDPAHVRAQNGLQQTEELVTSIIRTLTFRKPSRHLKLQKTKVEGQEKFPQTTLANKPNNPKPYPNPNYKYMKRISPVEQAGYITGCNAEYHERLSYSSQIRF